MKLPRLKSARTVLLLSLTAGLGLAACSAPAADRAAANRTLTVFAAASLTDAFSEVAAQFEAGHPGVSVAFNFGGSQSLRTQIEQGAPADVFASANAQEMDALAAAGLVAPGDAAVFLSNRLVVILPQGNPAGLDDLADLARDGVKLVLAAREVPAGRYSLQVLANLDGLIGNGYQARVLQNVVSYEQDVRQVRTKVLLGEADAGIVYLSDLAAAPALQTLTIPPEYNVTARYQVAALSAAAEDDLARAFISTLLSPAGQAILRRWGFEPPE